MRHANLSHGSDRRFPMVALLDSDQQDVLLFDRAVASLLTHDMSGSEGNAFEGDTGAFTENRESGMVSSKHPVNAIKIAPPEKTSLVSIQSKGETVNLTLKAFPYFMSFDRPGSQCLCEHPKCNGDRHWGQCPWIYTCYAQ